MSIIVVGKNSMMGREMQKQFPASGLRFLNHAEALSNTTWATDARCVINFAFSPQLRHHDYDPAQDIDLKLARAMNPACHYLMVSSRAVYGPGVSNRLFETDTPHPQTVYGRNKWHIEQQLQQLCGDRLTVVRCANVFGHEYGRKSFFGMALTNLKNMNQIIFDMNPDVRRDFIAVWHVVRALYKMAQTPNPGLYNLGSGFGTPCRDIAEWIIKGYGQGEITSTSDERRDSFYLDMQKTQSAFSLKPLSSALLEQDCYECGKALKDIAP